MRAAAGQERDGAYDEADRQEHARENAKVRRLPPVALLVLGRLARAMSQREHDRSSLVRAPARLGRAALKVEGLTFEIHVEGISLA